MHKNSPRILLIEEGSFMRVCSSILEAEGFRIETIASLDADRDLQDLTLIITSYPHGDFIFDRLQKLAVPVIVLCDHISEEIISLLQGFNKSYCMTKPLDYMKFKTLVKQLMGGEGARYAGFSIV